MTIWRFEILKNFITLRTNLFTLDPHFNVGTNASGAQLTKSEIFITADDSMQECEWRERRVVEQYFEVSKCRQRELLEHHK